MSYYTNDTDTLRQMISQSLPQLYAAALTLTSLILIMLFYSVNLMVVAVLGILAMFFVTKKIGGGSAKFFIKQQQALGKVEGYVEEMLNGQKVIQVFCHEEAVERDFDAVNDQLFRDSEKAHRFANVFAPIINNIGNILYVCTAFVGGYLILSGTKIPNLSIQNLVTTGSLTGALTLPIVASYLGMCKQFTGNISQVSKQINSVAMGMAGLERIFGLHGRRQPEVDEGYVTLVNAKYNAADGELDRMPRNAPACGRGSIRIRRTARVTYTKLTGRRAACSMWTLAMTPDKTGAAQHQRCGPSRGRRSRLSARRARARRRLPTSSTGSMTSPTERSAMTASISIRLRKPDLRRSLGIVLQDTNLFTGTVMDNIRYGKLDATDEECIAAAKLANARRLYHAPAGRL